MPFRPGYEYEDILLKWVVLPLVALSAISLAIEDYTNGRACQRLAEERGFLEGKYLYPLKSGLGPGSCICTQKVLPGGRVDSGRRLVIEMRDGE